MKKLTKKQRHEMFTKAFNMIESKRHLFMCNAIEEVLRNEGDFRTFNYFDEVSKEASIMCPENYPYDPYTCITATMYNNNVFMDDVDGHDLRLMILQFCIEMTK